MDWSEFEDDSRVSDHETIDGTCESCEQKAPLKRLADPFIAELAPEVDNEPKWVCATCFGNRCMDI